MSDGTVAADDELATALKALDPAALGRRIRDLRLERRLTQRDLAGDRVTVGYISRIESGRRRPEVEVLTWVAGRLGVPPEDLLLERSASRSTELRVTFDHAELEVASGNHARGLELLETVTERPGDDADVWAHGRYVRALALEGLGDLPGSIRELIDVAAAAEDPLLQARVGVALSRCLRESGDLVGAVARGEAALERLQGLGLVGTPEAVQLAVTVAAAHYEHGSRDHARALCARAIEDSAGSGSAEAQASALWNASVMESHRGAVVAALPLAERALALMEESANLRSLAGVRTLYGLLLLDAEHPDLDTAAGQLERAAEEYGWSGGDTVDVQRNRLALARLELCRGNLEQALATAEEVHARALEQAPLLAGSALVLTGKVLHAQGDVVAATSRLRDAIVVLSRAQADHRVAQTWVELGEQLETVGAVDAALDCFRRAAVSAGLQVGRGLTAPAAAEAR